MPSKSKTYYSRNHEDKPIDETDMSTVDVINKWKYCEKCKLSCWKKSNNFYGTVVGDGPPDAPVVLIGQWPGKNEEISGLPMQGDGGRVTKKAITEWAGLPWNKVYATNLLGCRPSTETDANAEVQKICIERIDDILAVVKPKLIVVIGAVAKARLVKKDKYRGFPVVAFTHPFETERQDTLKLKEASEDKIRKQMGELRNTLIEMDIIERDFNV